MSRHNQHIIRKQTVNLRVSRHDNSLALQQRFLRLVEEQLLPRLEPVFDRLAGPDEWIELDKLDIDLGYLAPDAPDRVWLDKAFQAYKIALEQHLDKPDTRRARATTQKGDLLAFFLTRGVLPWWAGGEKLETLIRPHLSALATRLPSLLASATARRRWVLQFDDAIQAEAFATPAERVWGPEGSQPLLPFTLEAWLTLFPGQLRRELRNTYWESQWETLIRADKLPAGRLPEQFRQGLSRLPDTASLEQTLELLLVSATWTSLPEAVKEQLLRVWAERWQALFHTLSTATQKKAGQTKRQLLQGLGRRFPREKSRLAKVFGQPHSEPMTSESWHGPPTIAVPAQRQVERRPDVPGSPDPDGLFVPLAGIVLAHPFLPAFFGRLGLLTDGQFSGEPARERAVHLLYHAATGLQHPPEEELPLLKLLCGMAFETPLERELDLSETEQTETRQLLLALAGQCDALSGATPDDLRGSFFIRDGKLHRGDLGWNLTVETKTWDILLTRLPWGLSPVMHTWMQEMVWVDWV